MKSYQRERGWYGAARGEYLRAALQARWDGNERPAREGIGQVGAAGESIVEVARKVIIRDEDMGLAAQAPAQRAMMPGAAASQ